MLVPGHQSSNTRFDLRMGFQTTLAQVQASKPLTRGPPTTPYAVEVCPPAVQPGLSKAKILTKERNVVVPAARNPWPTRGRPEASLTVVDFV